MPWSAVTQKKLFQQKKPMRAKQQLIWPLTSTDFKSVDSVVKKIKEVAAHLHGEGSGCL